MFVITLNVCRKLCGWEENCSVNIFVVVLQNVVVCIEISLRKLFVGDNSLVWLGKKCCGLPVVVCSIHC